MRIGLRLIGPVLFLLVAGAIILRGGSNGPSLLTGRRISQGRQCTLQAADESLAGRTVPPRQPVDSPPAVDGPKLEGLFEALKRGDVQGEEWAIPLSPQEMEYLAAQLMEVGVNE